MKKFGCENVHMNLVHPVLTHGSEKQLYMMLLSEAQDKYIEQGVTTKDEVSKLLEQMEKDTASENCYIGCCENAQISTIKPFIS